MNWKNSTKQKFVNTYKGFLKYHSLRWSAPKYKGVSTLPFMPLETEIDQLIAYLGRKTAPLVQTLKETGIRCGEAMNLKWTDLDEARKTLNITPEKGSNPRILPASDKLITSARNPRSHTTNRSRISIRYRNGRTKTIQETQISTQLIGKSIIPKPLF